MAKLLRMRSLAFVSVIVIALLVACGPSSGQVRAAREARYSAERDLVFETVVEAVESLHKLEGADPFNGVIRTDARWYEPDGNSAHRGGDDESFVTDGSVLLALLIEVKGEPSGVWYLVVTPLAVRHQSGSPQPRELKPDDPQMPGWVQGKVDNIYLTVHAKLKEHVVAPEAAQAP